MASNQRRWVLRRGSSSSENGRRRRRLNLANPTGLIDLPADILQSIMLHVTDFEEHTRTRASCRTLRRVTDDEAYLRHVDLFTMQTSNMDEASLMNFRLLCHHRGNVSGLFLIGCSEFWYRSKLDNGLAIIRECAFRGYELAIYVYSNLKRIMTPNLELDLQLVNPDRDLVHRMRERVEYFPNNYWGPEHEPELYEERCRTFDWSVILRCRCARVNMWHVMWDESVKDPGICDLCFYTIHAIGFKKYFPSKICEWPFPFEF